MKISEITAADIWRHIRESPEDMETEDNTEILVMKKAAVEFCKVNAVENKVNPITDCIIKNLIDSLILVLMSEQSKMILKKMVLQLIRLVTWA